MWLRFSYNNMHLLQKMDAKVEQLLLIICIIIPILSAQDSDLGNLQTLLNAWQNTPPTWDDDSDPCTVGSWKGITCTNGRVTKITLSSMQLSGELPEDIDQFTELEILDLSYNKDLGGLLPSKIGNLKNLKNLILVGCSFNGPIPETIRNLESLVYLSLNSNSFTGRIPPSVGNLKNLVWLDLSTNNLNESLPVSSQTMPGLDNLTHAKHFHLGDNQLSGDIPLRLFNSNMKLIHLLLENNNLTGTIPSTLGLVTSLTVVRLDKNLLRGSVPSNINNLTNTTEMFLSNNRLTGPIPDLTGMSVLNYIDLSDNSFDPYDVPSWLSTLHALTTIKMHNTNLGGEIPVALFRLPQLQHVVLSNNQINGTLDISSNPSTQLELVDLQTNDITDFTQRRHYLNSIDLILQGNLICTESGVNNESFCSNTTNTDLLNLSYSTPFNNCAPTSCVDGRVSSPNCQCAFPYTGFFTFKAPSFSSTVNSTIYISLHDSLMGFFKNASLPIDSISLNNLSRNSEDYLMVRLDVFPLGTQGCFNRTGILEIGFALSNQTFKPKKDFNTYVFDAESYNKFCSGILLGTEDTKNKSSNTGIIIGSVVGGCVFVVLLVLAGMYAFRRKDGVERATQQSQPFALWDPASGSGAVPQIKGIRSFTYEELQKYTNNFSETNNIGKGGYGMVYKGSLPNGQLIAIKRAKEGSSQGGLEFKTEIELLSRVHHKNVVGLIGFCFDQGEQMLVYEYIVNGTLKDSLSRAFICAGRSGIRLDWTRRLKIALGAARGLQYLHDHADPPIIHRDVKTNNILLDERLVAKVSDFGLSKPLSDADRTYVTTQVKGTMGYMDPEYYMTQQLTEKSDVYSFGVVMLELITARNPIEKGRYIVREVILIMDKNKELYDLQDVLDPTIGLSSQLKGMERFVDVALMCVEDTGQQRPTMSEVVKELESIMDLVGLSHGTESSSTSVSYEGTSKDHSYPYSNDSLFSYSGGSLSPKLHPK
ncbi:leucine-rich repeat receptor protein kinase HPCA1-like [Bidens hawaiensis]|uniref:leucine-rich repeat receptor protein kinase HPCA1-like n=1 Tax=Bidens hawaiensis TaxID=980011 RepID=UPI00404A083A